VSKYVRIYVFGCIAVGENIEKIIDIFGAKKR